MLLDSAAEAVERVALGFAPTAFRLAAPRETATTIEDLRGTRIATSYAGLLTTWLAGESIDAAVVRLGGAVEGAVALGVADAVSINIVVTGITTVVSVLV